MSDTQRSTAFALPIGYEISVRNPSRTVRDLVEFVVPKWQGKRLTIEYATRVDIRVTSNGWPRVKVLNLATGSVFEPVLQTMVHREGARAAERRSAARGVSGTIDPGHAVVALNVAGRTPRGLRSGDPNTSTPTLYLHALTENPDVQSELDVARDAFLSGDTTTATRISLGAIPLTAALFMTILDHEAKHLCNVTCRGTCVSTP